MEHATGEPTVHKNMTLFGKVYADPEQARSVQALQQLLYDEQPGKTGGAPILPRPLGKMLANELTFNEAAQPGSTKEEMSEGPRALQPLNAKGGGGGNKGQVMPCE